MPYEIYAVLIALALFVGMVAMQELGHRIANRVERFDPDGAHAGTGPVEGAIFALLGLLVAFTFSGAASRFDARRQLIVQEANDVGTAYLRLDYVPPGSQPELRDLFRRYLDTRLAVYRRLPDLTAAQQELAQSERLQAEIWAKSFAACRDSGPPCPMLLMPALNAMIDITSTRTAAARMHPPVVTFWLLFGISLGCALLAGYSMASGERRKWTHILVFAAVTSLTVYVILDLEYPRLGLIRIDGFDRMLVDVRASMDR